MEINKHRITEQKLASFDITIDDNKEYLCIGSQSNHVLISCKDIEALIKCLQYAIEIRDEV